MARIVAVSDTHGQNLNTKWEWPPGDILVHAGDMTPRGSINDLAKFGRELSQLPYRYKIVIAGNHDRGLARPSQRQYALGALYPHCIYLEDELVEIMGVRFYGMPWIKWNPELNNDARCFNIPDTNRKIDAIPVETRVDVLITHAPPNGILDEAVEHVINKMDGTQEITYDHIGDPYLTAIYSNWWHEKIAPRVNIFGHNHTGNGHKRIIDTDFYNVSLVDDQYKVAYEPTVIEL